MSADPTKTTDLIAELRGWREGHGMSDDAQRKLWLMRKAADEIERMRAQQAADESAMTLIRETAELLRRKVAP